ncbi:dTDP-4-dehydrorhamnose reductase [Billgrantia diversa]|uniref:dTDP-4-dehydrorhamnose reductase n=1 Tax=Halomonas sp. MCCC 1A13316 TaxID=2733487 RepID=UPI0018A5B138|nr:dTDP-4-dehydrorhamnose reductase [Halomonas sp. MCCC 1A13316]QOR37429.1 dTDP-4-dehydrorhamnose reductase [Halomonas sp. MCCC 1A13316]
MNILLTGGTGQVGFELLRSLAPLGNVIAPTRAELDLTDLNAVAGYLSRTRPGLIVNAAAWTAVDAAESHRDEAFQLNAELPEQLAIYAARRSIPLIHYSSDYVYSGEAMLERDAVPWQEDSPTGPLSIYGASKLAGDQAIIESVAQHVILRTSWVYAARGNNFMRTMLRLGRERDALKVVCDQHGAPTPARLIAEITALVSYRLLHGEPIESGIYHLAPRGETSWHGFAREIFRLALAQGEALAITPERVEAITTAEYPTPAQRPLNSRLSLSKLEDALGIALPHWQAQLALTLSETR